MKEKTIKLYNMIFPLWMLMWFPHLILFVLPANFIIDSLVFVLSLMILKVGDKGRWYRNHIFGIFGCGMLADFTGAAFMVFLTFVGVGSRGDELYLTVPGLLVAAAMIFIFDYFFTFKKADGKLRFRLSLIFAVVTAPYTFLVPSGWMS